MINHPLSVCTSWSTQVYSWQLQFHHFIYHIFVSTCINMSTLLQLLYYSALRIKYITQLSSIHSYLSVFLSIIVSFFSFNFLTYVSLFLFFRQECDECYCWCTSEAPRSPQRMHWVGTYIHIPHCVIVCCPPFEMYLKYGKCMYSVNLKCIINATQNVNYTGPSIYPGFIV